MGTCGGTASVCGDSPGTAPAGLRRLFRRSEEDPAKDSTPHWRNGPSTSGQDLASSMLPNKTRVSRVSRVREKVFCGRSCISHFCMAPNISARKTPEGTVNSGLVEGSKDPGPGASIVNRTRAGSPLRFTAPRGLAGVYFDIFGNLMPGDTAAPWRRLRMAQRRIEPCRRRSVDGGRACGDPFGDGCWELWVW